jgi:hypothetical protein
MTSVLLLFLLVSQPGSVTSGYEKAVTPIAEIFARGAARVELERTATSLAELVVSVEQRLGRRIPSGFRVILVPDLREFRRVVVELGGREPTESTRGVAFPSSGQIVVRTDSAGDASAGSGFRATLLHELAHLAMRGTRRSTLPRWLDEGVAEWIGRGGISLEEEAELIVLARMDGLYRISTLEAAFPEGHVSTSLAYRQSHLFVLFLIDRRGELGLRRFLSAIDASGSVASALADVYELDGARIEEDFRVWLSDRASIGTLLLVGLTRPWALISVLACAVVLIGALRRRRAWRQLEDDSDADSESGELVDEPRTVTGSALAAPSSGAEGGTGTTGLGSGSPPPQ